MKKLTHIFAFLLSLMILSGCQTYQTTTDETTTKPIETVIDELFVEPVPVVRHNRYTFVELKQVGSEQDLLSQIVEVSIPISLTKHNLTVKDGLSYVLLGSGYSLCNASAVEKFSKLPLPASQFRLGPVSLHSALKILAGPTWQMQVDQHNRVICFAPNPDIELTGVTGVTEGGGLQP